MSTNVTREPGFIIKASTIEPTVKSKAVTVTVDDTNNVAGITVTQSDVTNNPKGVTITNSGTGNALFIDQNGNAGGGLEAPTDGALLVDNTGSTDIGLQVYTNQGATTNSPLVLFRSDNTAYDDGVLRIIQDGTGGGAYNIRLDGPAPQIEYVETDQSTPAGKFENGVNGDIFYIAGRNAADNSFETLVQFNRLANTANTTVLSLGGIGGALQTVTGTSATLDGISFVTLCDATSNAITVNLPTASAATGRIYHIKKIDSSVNAVTIDASSTQQIDGQLTKVLSTQYESVTITSDGSNWFIL